MPKPHPERSCKRLADRRYGIVHRREALGFGMTPRMIDRRTTSGEWRIVFPSTYALFAAEFLRQRSMGACLWAGEGSAVTGPTAAALFGIECPQASEIHLLVARRLRCEGIRFHRACVERRDVTKIGPIPIAHPTRVLIDLAACLDEEELERALDSAWRLKLITIPGTRDKLDASGTRGRKGLGRLARLLEDRLGSDPAPESSLETKFLRLVRENLLPIPQRQPRVEGYRLDFYWPEHKVAVETDGRAFHSSRAAFENDRKKQNALAARGITLLRITRRGLHDDPCLTELRAALGVRELWVDHHL